MRVNIKGPHLGRKNNNDRRRRRPVVITRLMTPTAEVAELRRRTHTHTQKYNKYIHGRVLKTIRGSHVH